MATAGLGCAYCGPMVKTITLARMCTGTTQKENSCSQNKHGCAYLHIFESRATLSLHPQPPGASAGSLCQSLLLPLTLLLAPCYTTSIFNYWANVCDIRHSWALVMCVTMTCSLRSRILEGGHACRRHTALQLICEDIMGIFFVVCWHWTGRRM